MATVLVGLLAAVAVWLWRYPDQPGPPRSEAVTVEIPPGVGLVGIRTILARSGVIDDDSRFLLLAKWMKAASHLKAGEYAFPPGLSPRAVLLLLVSGKTVPRAITFPEGITLAQAADIVAAGGWGERQDFLRLVAEPEFIGRLGLAAANLEGNLFPDTYFFEKGTGLATIITTMVRRMGQVLDEEDRRRKERGRGQPAGETGESGEPGEANNGQPLTRHELLTLASIIEKETALAVERPLVAKVFLNRLRVGMKLQADPTVIYGLAKFGAPLTKTDLETATPYNTYVNRGLPVGPICNPGRTAIAAVLAPAKEDYYYFVSQNDGSHYFSQTLSEHNQAVARYRKKRLSNGE